MQRNDVTIAVAPEVKISGVQEQLVIKGRHAVTADMSVQCFFTRVWSAIREENETVIIGNSSVEISDSRVTIPHHNKSQVQLQINATTPQPHAVNYICVVINHVSSSSDTTSVFIQGIFCWCVALIWFYRLQ